MMGSPPHAGARRSSAADGDEAAHDARIIRNWALRPAATNDFMLRQRFLGVLSESRDAPPAEKLIMYDACDEGEVRESLGDCVRKRLDARRNTKPKKSDDQRLVCTPFNPDGFHFGKIRNDRERLLRLGMSSGRYDVLTNKFPLFPKHMLLVCDALVPQQMTWSHLCAITELLNASTFCAYFNSWCASASVNHFHCHLIDEFPPVTAFPLVAGPLVGGVPCLQPQGFPGFCYVFPSTRASLAHVDAAVRSMQADNQPHNLLFTPRFIYVWPKPKERPARSFELYPETVGGPELLGSFTVYRGEDYEALSAESTEELLRINTAPLPSRLLGLPSSGGVLDDAAVHADATTLRASRKAISASHTIDALPQAGPPPAAATPPPLDYMLHEEDWPQDRPIARALANNFGLV